MRAITKLEKSISFWFIVFISFIFFLLRWPSLFEPYWYGDEGVYQAVGLLIRSGQPLYSGAWDNKPPLLYLLYALFNSDQFLIRVVSMIFGLLSVWIFYLIAKNLFKSNKVAMVSTVIYSVAFGTRVIEGNIANAENFMLLPILASAYLIIKADVFKKIWQSKIYFFAGIILSLAFLTKIVAVFDFMAFGSFIFIDSKQNFKQKIYEKIIPFVLGFSIPVAITTAYFLLTNNFKDFMDAFIFSNIGYVGYANQFIIPQGLLYLKASLLLGFALLLYFLRKKISRNVLFVSLWFAFSLFDSFFSQRPFTHYLIMLLPSFCLMIGIVLYEKKERFFTLTLLIAVFLLINHTFGFKGKIISHYLNIITFCGNKKDLNSYQSFFDKNTPRDYELAQYIKTNTNKNDPIFIWGNNAQIYKLSEKTPIMRYTVAYHISMYPTGVMEMENAIRNKKPKLIIIMPNVPVFPISLNNYNEKIEIGNAIIYEKVL